MVAGLAAYLSMKLPNVAPDRIMMLRQDYEAAFQLAADEDREKASVRFVPRDMSYIRQIMPTKFASAKNSIAQCDRCGFRFKLKQLKQLVIKTKNVNILVCPECWEPDQPQLSLGLYPVNDPQAVRNPRPDSPSYFQAGLTGIQIQSGTGNDVDQTGVPSGGSRVFQWGYNPVGGASSFDAALTPNDLVGISALGDVTISIS